MDEKSLLEQGLHTPPDALYTGDPPHDLDRWDRPYVGSTGPTGIITLPNDQTAFGGRISPLLRMTPDYWIVRLNAGIGTAGSPTNAEVVLLRRDGGPDISVYLDWPIAATTSGETLGAEKRIVIPGSLRLQIVNNMTAATVYFTAVAIRGYDPASIF